MKMRIRNGYDATDLDKLAYRKASAIAEGHGLRDRAVTNFRTMADELLTELAPVIETQVRTEADQAAKDRLKGILGLPEAKGRRDLAERLALETDATVEQIKSMLQSTPTQAEHDPLAKLMRGNTPGITSDFDDPADGDTEAELARQIITANQEDG